MTPINKNFTLSFTSNSSIPTYQFKSGEVLSRKLLISLIQNEAAFNLTGLTAKIYILKPDNTKVFDNCVIEDDEKGLISYVLTTQCTTSIGTSKAEIVIYGANNEKIISQTFQFAIIEAIEDDSAIESTNELTALTLALNDVSSFKAEMTNAHHDNTTNEDYNDISARMDAQSASLADKANKDDVANIANGTPLFANDLSGMIDHTRAYCSLADGYIYLYNSTTAVFEKTNKQYQSSGIGDDTITYQKLDSKLKNNLQIIYNDVVSSGLPANSQNSSAWSFSGWINQLQVSAIGSFLDTIKYRFFSDTNNFTLTLEIWTTTSRSSAIYSTTKAITNGTILQEVIFNIQKDISAYTSIYLVCWAGTNVGLSCYHTTTAYNTNLLTATTYYIPKAGIISNMTACTNYYMDFTICNSIYVNALADQSVTTQKIADDSITTEKLSPLLSLDSGSISCVPQSILTCKDITLWGSNLVLNTKTDSKVTYTYSGTSDGGIQTPYITPDGNMYVHVEFDITAITGTANFYILGKKADNSLVYVKLQSIATANHYSISFDPAYYSVYSGFSVECFLVSSHLAGSVTIENLEVFQSAIYDTELYADTLPYVIKNAQTKLTSLNTAISSLGQPEPKMVSPLGNKFLIQVKDDATMIAIPVIPTKVLFIGNSLLLGNRTFGMAASNSNKDYYKYVYNKIYSKNPSLTTQKLAGTTFEGCVDDNSVNTWLTGTLASYMANDIDLVIIQLGDNVNTPEKLTEFSTSCKTLLSYIRQNCQKSRVVWVGEWFSTSDKQTIISNACKSTGCTFVDISDLNTVANQSAIGNIITYDDSTTSTISDTGVSSHPGDTGMLAIANRICYQLGITDSETEITA